MGGVVGGSSVEGHEQGRGSSEVVCSVEGHSEEGYSVERQQ